MTKLILPFLAIIFSCSQKRLLKEEQGLTFKAKAGLWNKTDSFYYLSIKTTLINNSPDTIRYVNMSCSSNIIYEIETNKLNIYYKECDKNYPKVYILLPYQTEQNILQARTQETPNNLQKEKFRVGFNYVPDKYIEDENLGEILSMHKRLIWSDTITIK